MAQCLQHCQKTHFWAISLRGNVPIQFPTQFPSLVMTAFENKTGIIGNSHNLLDLTNTDSAT